MQPAVSVEELLSHRSWLSGLARSLVADADEAREIEQETWLAALRRPPRDRRNLRGWLARVAVNGARRRWRRRRFEGALDDAVAGPESTDPADLAAEVEIARALAGHVLALEEPYRRAVLLRYWRGLDATEIAKREGVAAGTIRWRLSKGLAELRARLQREHGSTRAWALFVAPLARQGGRMSLLALAGGAIVPLALPFAAAALFVGAAATAWRVWDEQEESSVTVPTLVATNASRERPATPPLATPGGSADAPAIPPTDPTARIAVRDAIAPPPIPPFAVIRGRVVDPNGTPIAGARAVIHHHNGEQEAISTDDGRFALSLSRDQFERHFASNRRDAAARVFIMVSAPWRVRQSIDGWVEPDRAAIWNVVLAPAGAIEGRVEVPGAESMALDELVEVETDGSSCTVNPDGSFRLEGVPVGEHELRAHYWMQESSGVSARVTVEAARTTSGVLLRLPTSNSPIEPVRGVVLRPDGTPAARVGVATYGIRQPSGGAYSSWMETDGDGHFAHATPVLLPEEFEIWAVETLDANSAARLPGPITKAKPGDDVTLALAERRSLALTLTSTSGGRLRRVAMHAKRDRERYRERYLVASFDSVQNGETVEVPAPASGWTLEVSAAGHESSLWRTAMLSTARVRLRATPHVHGRALAPDGRPLAGADVLLLDEHRGTIGGVEARSRRWGGTDHTTEDDGAFIVELPSHFSRGYLQVRSRHFAPAEVEFSIARGNVVALGDVRVVHGGRIEGRVLDEFGAARPNAIALISRGDGLPLTQRTDERGEFAFERLTPGPWYVAEHDHLVDWNSNSLSDRSYPAPRFNTAVVDGETTMFDVVPKAMNTSAVRVRVVVDGEPAVGWRVELHSLVSDNVTAELDSDGRAKLETHTLRGRIGLVIDTPWSLRVGREIDLESNQRDFYVALHTGELVVGGVPLPEDDKPALGAWLRTGEWLYAIALMPESEGSDVSFRAVPGLWTIVRPDDTAEGPDDMPVVTRASVARGATTRVDVGQR